MARRILQRLDGMGKWGSYHTAFDHLARGFAGNERALAYEVGESLLAAGLLEEKPSVGQRHVYLSPRRSGDIRRLIDDGELPQELVLPPTVGVTRRPSVRVHAQRAAALHELAQLVAHQLAAPAVGHADVVAVLAAAQRADQRGQLGLGCDQLHGHARLHRAVAHQRLRERDERGVAGVARPAARSGGGGAVRERPRSIAPSSASARRWSVCGGRPRICSRPCLSRGVRRASSTSAWSGSTEPGGAVGAARLVLAPLRQLERHAARASR